MKRLRTVLVCLTAWLTASASFAVVRYDEGRRVVKGVQLLQDAFDSNAYFYVPQFPRLATREDGSFELLCLKYVDPSGAASGGLFHALVEFTLPDELLADLERELKKELPGARLVGPVPLMQAAAEEGENAVGAFEVVSGILADKEKGGFTRSMVASGRAPLTLRSRAVVAAVLTQQGATLLWNSLTGPTSDVSVAIHASYEAALQNYNARVTADTTTVYRHMSEIGNVQKGYTRRQIRNIVDDLQRRGDLKVEVLDRSTAVGIKSTDMDGILQVVTSKLTEVMFDHTTGWSADPPRETAVEDGQIRGRQDRGWFDSVFGGAKDTRYYTDDQYVLKRREDIRHNSFSLVLGKSSTIRVPVDTAGNLGGLYAALGTDPRYFRVVSLADPAFEFRPLYFQVDGAYVDSFQDTVNFVSVNVRKTYPGQPAFTRSLRFSDADVKAGKTVQDVALPRLGLAGANWAEYEYQIRWSLRDGPTVAVPAQDDRWTRSSDPAVSLLPPFERRVIEIDADRQLFAARGVATAVVEFLAVLAGKPKMVRHATLRASDASPLSSLAVYHDRGTPMAVRVSWYSAEGKTEGKLQPLDSDYLSLVPPAAAAPGATE